MKYRIEINFENSQRNIYNCKETDLEFVLKKLKKGNFFKFAEYWFNPQRICNVRIFEEPPK